MASLPALPCAGNPAVRIDVVYLRILHSSGAEGVDYVEGWA